MIWASWSESNNSPSSCLQHNDVSNNLRLSMRAYFLSKFVDQYFAILGNFRPSAACFRSNSPCRMTSCSSRPWRSTRGFPLIRASCRLAYTDCGCRLSGPDCNCIYSWPRILHHGMRNRRCLVFGGLSYANRSRRARASKARRPPSRMSQTL